MRMIPAAAALLGVLTFAGAALACGPYVEEPAFVRTPQQDSQLLVRRAAALDAEAGRNELAARQASFRATNLDQRARRAEQLAQRGSWSDRSRLLADADRLRTEAAIARSDADESTVLASTLRREARILRVRAQELAGGGNGWRQRRVASSSIL